MTDLEQQRPEYDLPTEWHTDFKREVRRLRNAASDQYMRAFYRRLGSELQTDSPLVELVDEYPERHENPTPSMAANQLFRAFQHRLLPPINNLVGAAARPLSDPNYPNGYGRPSGWNRVFETVINDGEEAYHIRDKFLYRNIQSNIPQRGGVMLAAAQLFGLEELRIYSGGHSMGLVEKMMALRQSAGYEYPPITVMEHHAEVPDGYTRRPELSRIMNQLVADPRLQVGPTVGVDLFPGRDIGEVDWARSCSFRPGEFINARRRNLVEKLIRADFPLLTHLQDDFGDTNHVDYLYYRHPELQIKRPTLGLFSFSLYQATAAERKQALQNVETILDTEGVALVLDFVEMTPAGDMTFADKWKDWDCNLYAKDMANKEAGWQHIFNIREGRAREVVLGSAVGELAVGALRQ
jgi:hypothetical protein